MLALRQGAGTGCQLLLLLTFSFLVLLTSATAEADTDSDTEDPDRQQSLSPQLPDYRNSLASMLGLPSWLSSLFGSPPTSSIDEPTTTVDNGEFGSWWTRAQDFIDRFGSAKTPDDRLRQVLGALEGLDDLLRSTVPRFDRFNCLERIMCEIAAPLEDEEPGLGNQIYDGVQTLQQLGDSSLLPDYQQDQEPLYLTHQFNSPHRQQFLQHQQHQQNLIQQQVQQLQGNQLQQLHGQLPQVPAAPAPVVPPLPYYIPTPAKRQSDVNEVEYLVPRGKHSEEKQEYPDNNVRRDEPYKVPYREPQQPNPYRQTLPSQHQTNHHYNQNPHQYQHQYLHNQHQYQQNPQHFQQQQRLDTGGQQPYELQQPSQNRPQFAAPPQRRRLPAWRRFVNDMFGLERPRRRINNPRPVRRGRRDTETANVVAKKSSRRAKISPMWEASTRKAKSKAEGPSAVRTLTREDLEVIKARIEAINKQVLKDAAVNGTTTVNGKRISGRRARFLDSFVNGWSAKTFLGLLDQLMDGYSFHPYTHAAYMGYTGRAGTCQSMYPRCPDSTSDWLDFLNNFHRYFPEGMPFRDSLPWPLNLLVP